MGAPEHHQRREPTPFLEPDLAQFLLAGRAERPFVIPGFGEVHFRRHNLQWLTVRPTVVHHQTCRHSKPGSLLDFPSQDRLTREGD